jgi:hypothetical protein
MDGVLRTDSRSLVEKTSLHRPKELGVPLAPVMREGRALSGRAAPDRAGNRLGPFWG